MGADLVTWSPSISSGTNTDDDYNFSGATKLDGTIDAGNPTLVRIGDASGFSAIPTLAQLNASSGLNQIIGAVNRRSANYNASFGTSLSILSYLTADVKLTAASILAIKNACIAVRAAEGFGAFTWPTAPAANALIRGNQISALRKSLRISGVCSFVNKQNYRYEYGYIFGSPAEENYISGSVLVPSGATLNKIGYSVQNFNYADHNERIRWLDNFTIPEYLSNIAPSTVYGYWSRSSTHTIPVVNTSGFTLQFWSSDTSDYPAVPTPALGGSAYNTDNNEGLVTITTASGNSTAKSADFTTDGVTRLRAKAGNYFSTILGTDLEVADTSPAATNNYADLTLYAPQLIADFGA
jgi:hypothetical protein